MYVATMYLGECEVGVCSIVFKTEASALSWIDEHRHEALPGCTLRVRKMTLKDVWKNIKRAVIK